MYKNTFVIVAWKNAELTEKAINSALKQPKSFVVAIDNELTHVDLWKKLKAKKHANLKLIKSKENLGWVGGVNLGVKKSPKCEYLTIMNNDVELPVDYLDKTEPHFIDNVGAVGPIGNNVSGLQLETIQNYPVHHKANLLIGYCITMKRDVLSKIGDELDPIFGWGLSDDLDLSLRITKLGYDLIIARDCKVFHHGSKAIDLMYKNKEEYQADLDNKNKIFINKWGKKELENLMRIEQPVPGTIAVPHLEMIHSEFFTSFRKLKRPKYLHESFIKGTLITKARNDLVEKFKGDWLLFIDSDMTFEPDALNKLIAHDLDIVGGLCFRRVPPYNPTIYQKINGSLKWQWQHEYPKDSLFEVDATGCAFMLIKKRVFEKLKKPYFEYNGNVSEDLFFCHKAKEAGFKIWIDSSVKIGHLGMFPVDEKFYENYISNKKIVES